MKNLKKLLLCGLLAAMTLGAVACTSKPDANVEKGEIMKGADLQAIEDDKEAKENYLVIDVRSEDEYNAGHVKFAINIPVDELESRISEIEGWKEKNVVVYCNSGKKSGEAKTLLEGKGFKNVFDAEGVKQYEYKLVTWGNLRYDELLAAVKAGNVVVVDMRTAEDYAAAHFACAINGDVDNLEALKDLLPEDKNTYIITHCYSGNRSAVAAQYIVELGYTNVDNCMDGAKEVTFDFAN